MELRTLKYFLAVVQEGNISNAAKALHVTQPTLSRQLAALEDEMGRELYTRTHKGIQLTEAGIILQRHAESIVALAEKAEEDMKLPGDSVSGAVHIGAGETYLMGVLAEAMVKVREEHPGVTFEIYSGTSADLKDDLIRGFCDIMLECELQAHAKFNVMRLPWTDRWGLLTRKDSDLAKKKAVSREDLVGRAVISSRQGTRSGILGQWLGDVADTLNVAAVYNLPLNGKFLVQQGVGDMLVYEKLIDPNKENELAWIPLEPELRSIQGLVWRKTLPTKQTQVFLDTIKELVRAYNEEDNAAES